MGGETPAEAADRRGCRKRRSRDRALGPAGRRRRGARRLPALPRRVALLVVLRATVGRLPVEGETRLDRIGALRPPGSTRIAELRRLELDLELAAEPELDAYYRIRPLLHRIAESRLRRRGPAAEMLEQEVWELLRPDRARQRPGSSPGLAEIEAVVDALERI